MIKTRLLDFSNSSFPFLQNWKLVMSIGVLILSSFLIIQSCSFSKQISYSTEVKPILNKHCLSCHGGVKKQSGFSLLFEEEALAKCKSGKYAIVPGDAGASEMIRRITSSDLEDRMPHHKDPLKAEEIEVLKKWINQGAKFETHWAYKSVEKQEVPDVNGDWAKNDIDKYIQENAEKEGLKMSAQANAQILGRRAALDIIGLPSDNTQKQAFLKIPDDKNYENYVDALLKSNQYGEKWTSMWLDLARYADTKGYERDAKREIWRYRDWLIEAFNNDMPYNQFLTEQLAGDLVQNPTEKQYIATAYHRNSMTNDEGGTDNEEFRVAANIDRVNTTWETLMGTTFSCVQCHSHPYDPIKHEDYYKFMSFFNNGRDEDTYEEYPTFRHFKENEKQKLEKVINWVGTQVSEPEKRKVKLFLETLQPSYSTVFSDNYINAALIDTKWLGLRNNSSARFKNVNLSNKSSLILSLNSSADNADLKIRVDSPDGPIIGIFNEKAKFAKDKFWQMKELNLKPTSGVHDIYLTYSSKSIKTLEQNGVMLRLLHFNEGFKGNGKPNYEQIKSQYWDLVSAEPETTPIMLENPADFRRKNQVFERGSFLNRTTEVGVGVPAILANKEISKFENRLDLAKWMTSPKNPLVARTMVNRVWEQLFGYGIVETLEDLGSQSASPLSQALLDDLSWKFIHDYNWSVKRLIKEIMLSATYRQSSLVSKEALAKDPFNKYLARGPRIRLSAEQIRDQALAISGALNPKMYGPSVMPFQPEGIWKSPYSGDKWVKNKDNEQYRRAVYTFWKRTAAYPSMVTFDGVNRELCLSRRIRTNTPLQAFVTLNDSVYIDLAGKLAIKSMELSKNSPEMAIKDAYLKAVGKNIDAPKLSILMKLFVDTKKKYQKETELKKKLMVATNEDIAAMTIVCSAILNLDDFLTKS